MVGRIRGSILRTLAQSIALRLFRVGQIRRVVATPVGAALFETIYFKYKELIEAPGTDQLRQYLGPSDWAIDVGANVGFFTEKFARWVEDGKVLAIEPETANFARLIKRLADQRVTDRVVAKHGAAVDRGAQVCLTLKPEHPGDHSLSVKSESSPNTIVVPAWRVDDLLAAVGSPPVGLIKIDVQGAEMKVLLGAENCITRDHPAIYIEIDDRALNLLGTSANAVLSWLVERGYKFYVLARSERRQVTREQIRSLLAAKPPAYCDVLAVATDRRAAGAKEYTSC